MTRGILFVILPVFVACSDRDPPVMVPGGVASRGRTEFGAYGCGSCHTIAGENSFYGKVGPPLTGIASRIMLAGKLPNEPDNMVHWISNPQKVEPNTDMPDLGVTDRHARDIAAYLYTMR